MKRLCIYCGSNPGRQPLYREAAEELVRAMAQRGLGLVYGGAHVGIMGVIADTMLDLGGEVIGVIPHGLVAKEVAHEGLNDLRIVDSMHERKALMLELADGAIALPGGLGTLDETFEALTWAQLGIHNKPCGLLNVGGYYDHLAAFLGHAVQEGYVKDRHKSMLLVESSPEKLLEQFAQYEPPTVSKWVRPEI